MRYVYGAALVCAAAATFSACEPGGTGDTATLETTEQKASYAIGRDVGRNMAPARGSLDVDAFMRGFREVLAEEGPALPEEELRAAVQTFSQSVQQAQQAERQAEGEENVAAGEAFMAENGDKEGVTTTGSGLQFEIIEEGDGASPGPASQVTINYEGKLIDGTVFDSSYERGEPATFSVDGVIQGFAEGLQMMQEGGRYRLVIPGDLAYGLQGAGEQIGPNATLIFEVEMIEVDGSGA